MLNITVDDFIALLNEVWVSVKADGLSTPGNLNAQCEDLAQLWARVIGSPRFTGATADLIYNQPSTFYTQVPNNGNLTLQKGDLVVWNWPHVGIASGNGLEVLEQNDPTGSEVHLKTYPSLDGVICVLRPNQLPTFSALPPNYADIVHGSTQWDETVKTYLPNNDPTHTDFSSLQTVVAGYKSIATASNNQVSKDTITIAGLNQQIQNINEKLAVQEDQCQKTQESLLAQIDALKSISPANEKLIQSYEGQIGALQLQIKQLLDDKHALAVQLAQCQAGNQKSFWQYIIDFIKGVKF